MNYSSDTDTIDLYGVLMLERTADSPSIQKAYKNLSRHFHPDKRRTPSDKEKAEAIFVKIKQAHDILSDRVLRFAYDHGGMICVEMVKRSQSKAGMDEQDEKENNRRGAMDEEDGENFYLEIKNAKSRTAALKVVRRLLREYEHHQASSERTPLESTLTLNQCYNRHAPHPPYLASENTTMRLETNQTINKQTDLILSCTSQVQRTSTAALTTQVGLGYRPEAATQLHAFAAFGTGGNPPQITLQTSRRTYDKSMLSFGAGGSVANAASWACTLASSRVLLLGSLLGRVATVDDTKLHASWRLGLGLSTGQLQSLMAQIRTSHFPQWKLRIGLDGPLLKLSYNHAAENSYHGTLSWHWLWWKAKVTKEEPLNDHWSIRYGVKYDFRGLLVGQPWSVLLHFHSDEWTLHVPIDLIYGSEWPVTSVLSFLAAHVFDDYLETYAVPRKLGDRERKLNIKETSPFEGVMRRVAAKKREEEEQSGGLVFMSAVWKDFSASSREDVTDLLQFWTVHGFLRITPASARWSASIVQSPEPAEAWWWILYKLVLRKYWRREPPLEESIYVRYQFGDKVYEVELLSDEETLCFPNPKATLMGQVGTVM